MIIIVMMFFVLISMQGRQAMEYVIGKINGEMQELSKSVDGLAASAKRRLEDEINSFNFQGSQG